METLCPRPQFPASGGPASADTARPDTHGEHEERGERQTAQRDRYPEPQPEPGHRGEERHHVGDAYPQFLAALDHEAAVERPFAHGDHHVRLGLAELLARCRGVVGGELGTAGHHLERCTHVDADRIDIGPLGRLGETFDLPVLGTDLPQLHESTLGKVEQGCAQPVLGDALGTDELGLHRPEPFRRGVLHREPRCGFDGGPRPEVGEQSHPGGQQREPDQSGYRPPEDPVPRVRPRQRRLRRWGHVDAGAQRHRGVWLQAGRHQSHGVAVGAQIRAGAADAESDTATGAGDLGRQRDRDFGPLDRVVPRGCDDVPVEGGSGVGIPGTPGELTAGTDAARIQDTSDGVADLEDVAAVVQGGVGVTDLCHPEPLTLLPQQLVGRRRAVQRDRRDLGYLPEAGIVLVGHVPVAEDAVPPAGEITGDGLDRGHPSGGVNGEISTVIGDQHRIGRPAGARP